MPVKTSPPDAAALARALSTLGLAGSLDAALHLALPLGDVPGFSVRSDGHGWSWRGVSVLPTGAEQAAALLACLGWRPGDEFLDLSTDPVCWLKTVRSGSSWYVFGLDCLLGLPLLRLPAALPRSAADQAGRELAAGRLRPGSRMMGGQVRAVSGCWELAMPPRERSGLDASLALAGMLGGELVDLPGSVGVRLPSGELLAVPADCDGESVSLRPFPCLPSLDPLSVPAGFRCAGVTEHGASVVEHESSGVRAIAL